jgi:N-acetyl-gamma-glutamyl-phosphate/LysW-gamma-L-alpha-aminoadipyl-6-phosphate reductase
MVRGVLTTAHVFLERPMSDREIWGLYREAYKQEPFMRVVKERQGVYRYPEPKFSVGRISVMWALRPTRIAVVSWCCAPLIIW